MVMKNPSSLPKRKLKRRRRSQLQKKKKKQRNQPSLLRKPPQTVIDQYYDCSGEEEQFDTRFADEAHDTLASSSQTIAEEIVACAEAIWATRHLSMPSVAALLCDEKFAKLAPEYGFEPGFAMDVRTGYDFDRYKDRAEAERQLRLESPKLLIGSPMCGPFSSMQKMNDTSTAGYRQKLAKAMRHLRFTIRLFKIQVQELGGYVLFEHPLGARSWQTDIVKSLLALPGMNVYKGHQCIFHDKPFETWSGSGYIYKKTGWATNSPKIGNRLSITCK